MTDNLYRASTLEVSAAISAIATARMALQNSQAPSLEIMNRLNRTLADIGRWRRPEDDLLLALTAELELLRERLQTTRMEAARDIMGQTAASVALRAYATPEAGNAD
ncbi:hypothetical protein SAMN07250955_106264 [Arboricoccus pini]|uniref:Flagellar protein FliT n=1 Tax=Arboricoccus pini TaxID=1963835 RepID=A0A212R9K9_9PROT|nr:hypothetical protein [Arboricoccus pini]SNB68909.1 hypothetical protein SAMN07250955_106264 [Arboricoccus pini]